MGVKKVKATQVVCDACGATQVVTDVIDVIGYSGTVAHQHAGGGTGSVKWFACDSDCIRLATLNALASLYD